jgi:hypothetical protein
MIFTYRNHYVTLPRATEHTAVIRVHKLHKTLYLLNKSYAIYTTSHLFQKPKNTLISR